VKKQPQGTLRFGVLASAVSIALAGGATPASAQEQVEELVVTGSRIVRRDLEATSPLLTIDATRFEETSSVGIESVMNQLPQFVPAVSQFDAGNTFAGSQRTPGAATLSLRGLGANRNLVLLDGRRAMPINASMAVSINTIPSAAIARIETITGGASSVYGADAVAGVVNFVTKQDFEGFDFDVQTGETLEGDGQEQRFSAVFGSNLADDRGNVMLGFERSTRDEIRRVDRDFFRRGFIDPRANTAGSFWSAAGYTANAANPHSQAVQNSIFGISPVTGVQVARTGTFYMNPDGTLYKTAADGTYRYNGGTIQPSTGLPWRKLDPIVGTLRENQHTNLAQIPLERYSLFGRGNLELSDSINAFAQVLYSENSTRATGSDPPMLGGWRTPIPHGDGIYAPSLGANGNTLVDYLPGGKHNLNCAPTGGCTKSQVWPTPPELTALLNSRPNREADFDVVQSVVWAGSRRSYVDTSSHQIVGGLDGRFAIKDWTWEAYASSGSTRVLNTYQGATSLARWRFVQQQPNYGTGLFYTGNAYGGGFGAGTITCTSGIPSVNGVNGWTEGTVPSEDCQKAVTMQPKATGHMKQSVVEYNMQGSLADLARGDLRFAAGVSSRVNKYEYFPDPTNTPESVLDQPGAFFPVGEAVGKTEVNEIYGELLVPLLADKWGVESMSLELGYRTTDNNPSADDDTYKALLDWAITDRVRFRGGRQIANRAPNIGELFQASEQFAPFSFVQGDPCSTRNPAQLPYTANPTINPATAASVQALCSTIMGPQGASTFYGDPSSQPNGLQVARISNLIGNPNLRSETAETLTAGIVANLTERATLTVDWWQIRITDMIAEEFGDILYENCFDADTNPTYSPTHPACLRLVRDPISGANATISTSFNNEQQVDLAGFDVQFDWRGEVGPGALTVNLLTTIADHTKTRPSPTANWFDYKGSSGPSNIRSVNSYSYDYRLFTTVGYNVGKWNASMRWRYLPSLKSESSVRTLVSLDQPTGDYSIVDSSMRYALSERTEVRFGIDNLFNVDPEITFAESNRPDFRGVTGPGYSGEGDTNENFYDFLGRRWYLGFKMSF
jgi:iron complex outermembrane recepter protein